MRVQRNKAGAASRKSNQSRSTLGDVLGMVGGKVIRLTLRVIHLDG